MQPQTVTPSLLRLLLNNTQVSITNTTEQNSEDSKPMVNLQVLSIGSVSSASLFFLIISAYMCYLQWRLHRGRTPERRPPCRQLPIIPGVSGSSYEQPKPCLRYILNRALPPIPSGYEQPKTYLTILPDELTAVTVHSIQATKNNNCPEESQNLAYLVPIHVKGKYKQPKSPYEIPVPYEDAEETPKDEDDSGYVPMSPTVKVSNSENETKDIKVRSSSSSLRASKKITLTEDQKLRPLPPVPSTVV